MANEMFTYNKKMCPYGLESNKKKIAKKKKNPTYLPYFEIPCNRTQKYYFLGLTSQTRLTEEKQYHTVSLKLISLCLSVTQFMSLIP
jgi:hypothetical protein